MPVSSTFDSLNNTIILTYYQYSIIISSALTIITFTLSLTLFLTRLLLQQFCELRHSEISSKHSTNIYDVYQAKDGSLASKFVLWIISAVYFVENWMIMFLVFSALSYLGGATAFGIVHWGISFSVSVLITMVMSVHTFRYRNLHKVLRKRDFLEQEVALLIDHNRSMNYLNSSSSTVGGDGNEKGSGSGSGSDVVVAKRDWTVEMEHFKRPVIEPLPNNTANYNDASSGGNATPLSPMDESYKAQKLRGKEYGRCKYLLLSVITEGDIYFRSIELGITRYRVFAFFVYILFNMFMAVWTVSFFYGTCICEHPYQFSTTFTRFVGEKQCTEERVCALVLNLPRDPSTEMIIKYFTVSEPIETFVLYGSSNETLRDEYRVNCTRIDLNREVRTEKELNGRYLHTCKLRSLTPDTEYYFQAVFSTLVLGNATELLNTTRSGGFIEVEIEGPVKKFRTMSDHSMGSEVSWISAGEIGISDRAKTLIRQAARLDPHFMAFTGNMAYDSGLLACTNRWLEFFDQYATRAVSSTGHLIPLLTSIGQYEAKFHRYDAKSRRDILPYLHMFLHDTDQKSGKQATYHIHKLSNHTSLTVLDSGVFTSHDTQVSFMEDNWNSADYADTKKFVMYFHPMYPSYSPQTLKQSKDALNEWQPVFDQYGVIVALEGRDRTMKRTVPIRNNERNDTAGTVYVGDGSFGVMATNEPANRDQWYIERAQDVPHFWHVRSSTTSTELRAIDQYGQELDSLIIPSP